MILPISIRGTRIRSAATVEATTRVSYVAGNKTPDQNVFFAFVGMAPAHPGRTQWLIVLLFDQTFGRLAFQLTRSTRLGLTTAPHYRAPFSAIMIVGAFVLVEVTAGITEAS
jgi:hypothetical protein